MEALALLAAQLLIGIVEIAFHLVGERLFAKSRDAWPRPGNSHLHPLVPAVGFVAMGIGFGALGAGLMPVLLVPTRPLQVINLVVVPVAVGVIVEFIRRRKLARGKPTNLFDQFEYAGLFVFVALLTRFILLDQA